jgi:ferredoxin
MRISYIKGGITTMAYVIGDDCVSCGACAGGCPAGAISEGASHYEIDADTCIDCGACAGTCPSGAISQG